MRLALYFVLARLLLADHSPERLVIGQRTEPRSLNPLTAVDEPSRLVNGLLHASLLRTNPATQRLEPALAESWRVLRNGSKLRVTLRPGLRFSDGRPLTSADVAFSYEAFLDEAIAAPQREVLLIEGQPVEVHVENDRTVRFRLPGPSAMGERMLEAIPVLPRHRLEAAFRDRSLKSVWQAGAPVTEFAGSGPFRLLRREPGRPLIVERNPHYWNSPLPALKELEFVSVPTEDSLMARLMAGELDLIAGFSPGAFASLSSTRTQQALEVRDLGAALDYTFLLFNLNQAARRQKPWMSDHRFRRAVSLAIDRTSIVRLAYRGHATALWGHVTPARGDWYDPALSRPARSVPDARRLLRDAGFRWDQQGQLLDAQGRRVAFTIAASASNPVYGQIAALIQADLKQTGMDVSVVALEFRSLIDRVTVKKDFDTAVMAMRPGEVDPAADLNVLLSSGPTHLWNLEGPAEPWEREVDALLRKQMAAPGRRVRVEAFRQVQAILAEQSPFVSLASPNVLTASRSGLEGLTAAPGGHPALSNAETLRWKGNGHAGARK